MIHTIVQDSSNVKVDSLFLFLVQLVNIGMQGITIVIGLSKSDELTFYYGVQFKKFILVNLKVEQIANYITNHFQPPNDLKKYLRNYHQLQEDQRQQLEDQQLEHQQQ
jgi:hypothetical protein